MDENRQPKRWRFLEGLILSGLILSVIYAILAILAEYNLSIGICVSIWLISIPIGIVYALRN